VRVACDVLCREYGARVAAGRFMFGRERKVNTDSPGFARFAGGIARGASPGEAVGGWAVAAAISAWESA